MYRLSEKVFFSKDLARTEEDPSGWIFAQGGRAYLAFRPLAAYEWLPLEGGGRRLRAGPGGQRRHCEQGALRHHA